MENIIWIQNYQSPCGELILGSLDGKLCLCDWMDENRMPAMKQVNPK